MSNLMRLKTRAAHIRKKRFSAERERHMHRSSLYEFAVPIIEGAKNNPTAVECCIISSSEAFSSKKGNEILIAATKPRR